jgi:uncharacterized sulfatase
MMGEIFAEAGHRVGYSGKWHLDGGLYWGYGKAQGGFPQDWWLDGKNFRDELGPEKFERWHKQGKTWEERLERALPKEDCWAHKVTDRAIDFLETAGDEPFLFVAAFDEPHSPFHTPREFLEQIDPAGFEPRPNVNANLENKPRHHRLLAEGHENSEDDLRAFWRYYAACNLFVDYEVGRIIDAVDRLHGDDTLIVFTSDHGEQMGSHWCWGKGYAMYEENTHTPLMMRGPGVTPGLVCDAPVGQVDLLPTFCEYAGVATPEQAQGQSLVPCLTDAQARPSEATLITYTRFGNDGEPKRFAEEDRSRLDRKPTQEFNPCRAAVDERFKLVVNLLNTDEFYDHQTDPYEMTNLINTGDPELSAARDRLHDWLLDEMVRVRDPMRCRGFRDRAWR